MRTKGKCPTCSKLYSSTHAGRHLCTCTLMAKPLMPLDQPGYLLQISWAEGPTLYWMFVAVPEKLPLETLDHFLRMTWLECCDHLSHFVIQGERYTMYPDREYEEHSMDNEIGELLSPGMKCDYTYDMGSSTNLIIKVVAAIAKTTPEEVTLLMRNEPPSFSCTSCGKKASIVCSLCGELTCESCSQSHSCAIAEKDDYMLMPLVNSPRAGVCGYTG